MSSGTQLSWVHTVVGRGPISDMAADAGLLVAANPTDYSVAIITTDPPSVAGGAVFHGEPFAVAVRENRAYVGVTSLGLDSLAAVETGSGDVVASYPLAGAGAAVTGLAVHPDGKVVFVARTGRDGVDIAVVDTTADDIGSIALIADAVSTINAVKVSPDGRRLFAAVSGPFGGELVVVDVDEGWPIDSVTIGHPIRDLAVSPHGITVLAGHPRSGGVIYRIDAESHAVATSLAVGGSPTRLALDADGCRAYLVDPDRVRVVDLETGELIDTLAVGTSPSCVATGCGGDRLYVADYSGVVTDYPAERV